MGGLGEAVRVDLGKFLPALEIFTGGCITPKDFATKPECNGELTALGAVLEKYDISGVVNVYSGPATNDGEVLIPYTIRGAGDERIKGILRFNKTGDVYEGLAGDNKVASIPENVATLFIGGMIAIEVPKTEYDEFVSALYSGSACWLAGSKGVCNLDNLRAAKQRIVEARQEADRRAAEARQKAEAERARAAEAAQIKKYGIDTQKLWDQAGEVLRAAEEGSKAKTAIQGIMTSYMSSLSYVGAPEFATVKFKYEQALKMWNDITHAEWFEGVYKRLGAKCDSIPVLGSSTGSGYYTQRYCDGKYGQINIGSREWIDTRPKPPPERRMREDADPGAANGRGY